MQHALEGVALGDVAQVEPGGEMRAEAMDDDRANVGAERGKDRVEGGDGFVVEGVAFVDAIKSDEQHGTVPLQTEIALREAFAFGHFVPVRSSLWL